MAALVGRIKKILLSIALFSRLVVELPLRRYQIEAANAVIDSCVYRRGFEFLWVFPRQSGKDETIAQMVTFLLVLFHRVEACIVHIYPTSGQLSTGISRLENRLENLWTKSRWWKKWRLTIQEPTQRV